VHVIVWHLCVIAVTTAEVLPRYQVISSSTKPVDPPIIINQPPQPQTHPHPHPNSPVTVNNASVAAVRHGGGPPLPPTDVAAVRQSDGSVLIQWTPPTGDPVDHYTLQYRTVGRWLTLVDQLDADATSHVWTTASHGVVYRFRLLSVTHNSGDSLPSDVAILNDDGLEFSRCVNSRPNNN